MENRSRKINEPRIHIKITFKGQLILEHFSFPSLIDSYWQKSKVNLKFRTPKCPKTKRKTDANN